MKRRIELGVLLCGICILFFYLICQWKELERFSHQAGLRFEENGLSAQQIDNYNKEQREKAEKNGEEAVRWAEVTAWDLKMEQSICQEETGRQTTGSVLTVYGNMARVLPFSVKYGGFSYNEDTEGCVISSGLAWDLFGAEDVVGNTLQYENTEFQVRGVLELEESVLALYQTKKQEAMPYVELRTEEEPPAAQLSQISSSLGLFGEVYSFAGSFYCSVGRIVISLPFWLVFICLCRCFFRWCGGMEGKYRRIASIVGKAVLLLGIVAGIRLSISFTADFIPVQWSDFSFWSEKGKEVIEGIRARSRFPGVYWEQGVLGRLRNIVVAVIAMIIFLVLVYRRFVRKFVRKSCQKIR